MPFPWLHAELPAAVTAAFSGKSRDNLRREVGERARLLMHLGFDEAAAVARCRQDLAWEWEIPGPPPLLDEVPALVRAIYQRR